MSHAEPYINIGYIRRLDLCGVSVMSHAEPYINTENELVRHIVLGVLADIAKSEADWMSEQIRRGLTAKAKGKRLGAPSKLREHKHAILVLNHSLAFFDRPLEQRFQIRRRQPHHAVGPPIIEIDRAVDHRIGRPENYKGNIPSYLPRFLGC